MKFFNYRKRMGFCFASCIAVMLLFLGCESDSTESMNTSGNNSNGSSTVYTLSDGSTVSLSGQSYTSTTSDQNAVYVTNGDLTLTDCTITKTGDTSDTDGSSFYGTNAAVLSEGSSASITMDGGSITTNAAGANAFVAYGGTIIVSDVTIECTKNLSRGIHATGGGTITATNLTATTSGSNSSVIATDRGGGIVNVTGGTFSVSGSDSAVIYSTGTITVSGITGSSSQGEVAVVEGSNSAIIKDSCSMTSGSSSRGILILQSGSGDAEGTIGYFTMTGGSITLTGSATPLVEVVTNATGTATFNGVTLTIPSGILMRVDYNTRWSTNGATGKLVLSGTGSTYTGNVVADSYSTATVTVSSGATWNGAFDNANTAKSGTVTINGTWNLTGNSYADTVNLTTGAVINRNGYTLTYTSLSNSGTIN